MAKAKTVFVCQECGQTAARWLGRCPACSAWDSFAEERAAPSGGRGASRSSGSAAGPQPVTAVSTDSARRLATGVAELDRVLGGGLVAGSAVLLGGEPGVGKSTLLLQVAYWLAQTGATVLYATAEESAAQLKLRAERLNCLSERLLVLAENDLDAILAAAERPEVEVLIVDSIQMVNWSTLSAAPGSVGQVRECAAGLVAQAKRRGMPLFLVGHVTKDGAIAGPKVLEHLVDVVLYFEGDKFNAARLVRATKNRHGPANELAVFAMGSDGLRPVSDPSRLFLSGHREDAPGAVVAAPLEGSRPFLVEVQALVAPGYPGNARRKVTGADPNRAAMLLAVLEKRCGLVLSDQDVFVNVVGGAELNEPGADLALALAVAGSLRERPSPPGAVVVGEVGLGGEVRPVAQLESRLREAERLGFRRALIPRGASPGGTGLEVRAVGRLEEALDWAAEG